MLPDLSVFAADLTRLFREEPDSFGSSASGEADRFTEFSLRLFRLQHALNLPYRALCETRGVVPDTLRDWRAIPAVSTASFKEFDFTCLPEFQRTHYFESSGTTRDRRSRTYHSLESLRLYEASLLPWFRRHLLPETCGSAGVLPRPGVFLSLTPPSDQAPHSSLVHMLDTVSGHCGFQQSVFAGRCDREAEWGLDFEGIQAALTTAIQNQIPLVLAGTAFNFVHLLEQLRSGQITHRLPSGSRLMETGGYKGRSRELSRGQLHGGLSRTLGVPSEFIVTEYGMAELGSQAYDHTAGEPVATRVLQFPPWARATVVSAETGREVAEGETGLVRIVDLANAFSVAAVETEDLAIRRGIGVEFLGRRAKAEPRGCSLMAV